VWRWDNTDPFGGNPPDPNPSGLGTFIYDFRFPGQVWNNETQTAYNYLRDCYDPATGRFCQSDPIGLVGGLNTYAYVDSDPIAFTDESGLSKRGAPNQPYANQVIANVTANSLITQIRQYQPNFTYPVASAPGQGGYTPLMIRNLQQILLQARQANAPAPSYIITSGGMCLPVPQGSGLVPVINRASAITGQAFSGGVGGGSGLAPNVTQLRIMNPTSLYPGGYANYMNAAGQSVNPFTGQTLRPSDPLWHIPY